MLRLLVVLLLLANAGWWAWSHGWLASVSLPPPEDGQREPQRLQAQVRPEAVQVLPTAEARRLAAAACLQAGPYDTAAAAAAEAVLLAAGFSAGAWQRVPADGGTLLRLPEADPAQQSRLRATPGQEMFRACP